MCPAVPFRFKSSLSLTFEEFFTVRKPFETFGTNGVGCLSRLIVDSLTGLRLENPTLLSLIGVSLLSGDFVSNCIMSNTRSGSVCGLKVGGGGCGLKVVCGLKVAGTDCCTCVEAKGSCSSQGLISKSPKGGTPQGRRTLSGNSAGKKICGWKVPPPTARHKTDAKDTRRIECNWAGVKELSKPPFSYQNLSPLRELLNCCAIIQAKVGPTKPPTTGLSAIPPTNRSIS
ncbi:hypothetical protein FF38_06679 [Lucilia cuprina]|uniref:Uncharacterized protein n=1 Tax=Lucilia cuprina TaxID=7375 RepID=A0A0L0CB49_LUCCU|nr:hypothetical protein FF38_06679 [Lucilia cuprina]